MSASEVRPYMHKAILLLVEAHAGVGDVAPALITRVLEALVNGITEVALGCFGQIRQYGTGGMLTVSHRTHHFPCADLRRPRSRLSSSTNRSINTSLHKPMTHFPRFTIPSHKHTDGRKAPTTFIGNSIFSRSYLVIVGQRRGWRHYASSRRRRRRRLVWEYENCYLG